MTVSGRGRLANEQMFGTTAMYRNIRAHGPSASATVISDYFFTPLFSKPVNTNWPLTVTQVAFSTDPFDQNAVPVWTDLSDRNQSLDTSRGRQYELDVVSAGEAAVTFYDFDEVLNPTNPNGPYYPNVKVYRRLIDQAMWPPLPVGGAVNLLNTAAGYDCTFESYTVGTTPSWVSWTFTNQVGGLPVVSATNPHTGSQCLALTGIISTFSAAISLSLATIPGQVYTVSVWVRQTVGGVKLWITNGAQLASTSINAAYARISGTFTATQPLTVLNIGNASPPGSGEIRIDDVQLEPGDTMNAFSVTGPAIYGVFGGFVERWPSSWNFHGTYGMAQITAIDAFAPMAVQFLETEYRNAVQAKSPLYYWQLVEGSGATSFADNSGNGGPALVSVQGIGGPGTIAAGTAMNIAGDPSGTGVAFSGQVPASNTWTLLIAGETQPATIATGVSSWDLSFAVWISWTSTPSFGEAITITLPAAPSGAPFPLGISLLIQGAGLGWQVRIAGPVGAANTTGTASDYNDGKPHLFVGTIQGNISSFQCDLWVDGTHRVTSGTVLTNTIFGTGSFTPTYTLVEVAGRQDIGGTLTGLQGTYSHLAIWLRLLANAEIADLWTAGQGYPGERSDQRIARYLGYNYVAPSVLEVGASVMDVSNLADNTALLDACESVATSENGVLVVDPGNSGTVTFQARTHRYLETVASWVFGENGSLPNESDSFMRLVSNGWGTSDAGPIWTTPDTASDFSVNSGTAVQLNGSVSTFRRMFLDIGASDVDLTVDVAVNVASAATAPITQWICARAADTANYYMAVLTLQTDGSQSLQVAKRVNGTFSGLSGSTTVDAAHNAGDIFRIRFQVVGSTLQAKAWQASVATEPEAWQATAVDTDLTDGTQIGLLSRLETGNTNTLPVLVSFDSLTWTPGGDEVPYLEGISFDYDPTQVFNDVQVTRVGGVVAKGGTIAAIAASQLSYGKRSLTRTINVQSDLETQDAANWLFSAHQQPSQRLAQLVINPAANPVLWPAALGAAIGDRATVRRRTSSGYMMSADYFIERIEHSRNDGGQWQVTFQMSPAGGAFNYQPWILGDATYGVLGSTTVPGY